MSTLFLCRPSEATPMPLGFVLAPVETIRLNSQYLQAIESWGWNRHDRWMVLEYIDGQVLDDLVAESVDDEDLREHLCTILLRLAKQCSALAIWYAGFHDEVPITETPEEFVKCVREALAHQKSEPSARMGAP